MGVIKEGYRSVRQRRVVHIVTQTCASAINCEGVRSRSKKHDLLPPIAQDSETRLLQGYSQVVGNCSSIRIRSKYIPLRRFEEAHTFGPSPHSILKFLGISSVAA